MNKNNISPALLDVCKQIVQAAADCAVGFHVSMSDRELTDRGTEIAKQFIVVYVDAGMPYGKEEADLLRYIRDNTSYEIGS